MKSDHKYFNCSEDHEIEYVANQYEEKEAVKEFLKNKCATNEINNSTHEEVYSLLEQNNFEKK